ERAGRQRQPVLAQLNQLAGNFSDQKEPLAGVSECPCATGFAQCVVLVRRGSPRQLVVGVPEAQEACVGRLAFRRALTLKCLLLLRNTDNQLSVPPKANDSAWHGTKRASFPPGRVARADSNVSATRPTRRRRPGVREWRPGVARGEWPAASGFLAPGRCR